MSESESEVARQLYAEKIIIVITVIGTRKYDGNNQLRDRSLRVNEMQIEKCFNLANRRSTVKISRKRYLAFGQI